MFDHTYVEPTYFSCRQSFDPERFRSNRSVACSFERFALRRVRSNISFPYSFKPFDLTRANVRLNSSTLKTFAQVVVSVFVGIV